MLRKIRKNWAFWAIAAVYAAALVNALILISEL